MTFQEPENAVAALSGANPSESVLGYSRASSLRREGCPLPMGGGRVHHGDARGCLALTRTLVDGPQPPAHCSALARSSSAVSGYESKP
jgi:hypothetical protein